MVPRGRTDGTGVARTDEAIPASATADLQLRDNVNMITCSRSRRLILFPTTLSREVFMRCIGQCVATVWQAFQNFACGVNGVLRCRSLRPGCRPSQSAPTRGHCATRRSPQFTAPSVDGPLCTFLDVLLRAAQQWQRVPV